MGESTISSSLRENDSVESALRTKEDGEVMMEDLVESALETQENGEAMMEDARASSGASASFLLSSACPSSSSLSLIAGTLS